MSYQPPPSRYNRQTEESVSLTRRPLFKVLVAVILLGVAAYFTWRNFYREETVVMPENLFGAPPIAEAMGEAHDACIANSIDKFVAGAPKDDPIKASQALAKAAKHTILAPDLKSDGWTLKHADICSVQGKPAAHLYYTKGGQQLSIFSMPAATWGDVGFTGTKDGPAKGRPCVVNLENNIVYCFIGTGDMSTRSLNELVPQHTQAKVQP
jgi:hypothetical protein